ncbi:MAG: signal recognition particle protein Srp54 [Proteobacteria bacterium]|nr:signal recognition particle protein Srp54 [Pseudomonadota bacterium]
MLETLTRGFRQARHKLGGVAELDERNVAGALSEVRRSLLEADVDLEIVRGFLERVTQRCLGERVRLVAGGGDGLEVSPGDHFTKACFDELVELMGEEAPIAPIDSGTRSLMLVGLQGTGKTSTAAKLALHLKKQGERPLLVAADVHRPAAREQLRVLGERAGVEVFARDGDDAAAICAEAVEHARASGLHSVILDTAGRLQIDDALMGELERIAERAKPEHVALVCDAMAGREAVNVARGFHRRFALDGLILTKLDGDSRGGAALAIREATGVPIRWITTGEDLDRLEGFRPEGLASRILGMGDVVGLMQDFEQVVDEETAEEEARKLLQGDFSLQDFLKQLRTIGKLGPLSELMEKMPGMGDMMPEGTQVDPGQLKRTEAMILSMTPRERAQVELLNERSRQERVTRGSGTSLSDLRELLERFGAMRELMAQVGQAGPGLLSRIPGIGQMFGGGPPGMPGSLPAEALAGLGPGTGNRRMARAQRSAEKRQKRQQQRKKQRRQKKRRRR